MFTWYTIYEDWAGNKTVVAKIPNCGTFSDARWIVCQPDMYGKWVVIARLTKTYIDKLAAGRVRLYVQYKNRNLMVKFYKAVSQERIQAIAEELAQQYMVTDKVS